MIQGTRSAGAVVATCKKKTRCDAGLFGVAYKSGSGLQVLAPQQAKTKQPGAK